MADNIIENPKFDSFEVLLASLASGGTNIDRDRLMYEAGRHSARQTVPKKRTSLVIWRTVSVLSTCAAIVLAVLLVNRAEIPPKRIVRKAVTPEESSNKSVVEQKDSLPPITVQRDVTKPKNQFSTWVLAFFDILPIDDDFPVRRLDKLLEEDNYVYRRIEDDTVSSPQPSKTYRELMREFRLKTRDDRSSIFKTENTLDLFGEGR